MPVHGHNWHFGALQLVVVKAYPDREFSSQLLACALPAGDTAACKAAIELFLTQTPVVSHSATVKDIVQRIAFPLDG